MWPFNRPSTGRDQLWERLQALTADLEAVKARQRAIETEWSETLTLVRKAVNRLERANERADKREAPPKPPQEKWEVGEEAGTQNFGAKYRRLTNGGG